MFKKYPALKTFLQVFACIFFGLWLAGTYIDWEFNFPGEWMTQWRAVHLFLSFFFASIATLIIQDFKSL